MRFDDLQLDPCSAAPECFVLASDARGCYSCIHDQCVPSGFLNAQSAQADDGQWITDSDAPVTTVAVSEQRAALIMEHTQETTSRVDGWVLRPDGTLSHQGEVDYLGSENELIHEHSVAFINNEQVLGASIDRAGCAKGALRVGVATLDRPFTLTQATIPAELAPEPARRVAECPASRGAISPAVDVVATQPSGSAALVVWVEADSEGHPASRSSPDSSSPIAAALLRIEPSPEQLPRLVLVGEVERQFVGLTAVAPRVIGVETGAASGFILAHAMPEGLNLVGIAVGPQAALEATATLLITDPAVEEIAMSAGPNVSGERQALVAWTTRDSDRSMVRAAVVSWHEGSVTQVSPAPLALRTDAMSARALHVAYAKHGFSRRAPEGGWSVTWSEGSTAMAALVGARSHAPTPARHIEGDSAGSFVFGLPGEASPFTYAVVADSSRKPDAALRILSCE